MNAVADSVTCISRLSFSQSVSHKITQMKNGSINSSNVIWQRSRVTRQQREELNGHKGAVIWFTGLSGSGKSTLAHAVEERLYQLACRTFVFDGDNVRHGLCGDLGFSIQDRTENIRRIGEMVGLFVEAGMIALTAFISPFRKERDKVRERVGSENFIEIYCQCPLAVCEERDVKGLYGRARRGEISDFTGISSPYEEPGQPALALDTSRVTLEEGVDRVLAILFARDSLLCTRVGAGADKNGNP